MPIIKHKIDFDPTDAGEHDRIGAFTIGAGGNVVTSTTVGSDEALDVNLVQAGTALGIYVEDEASVEDGNGQVLLAQRQDTLATSTSADNDWGYFKQSSVGELYVVDSGANTLLGTIDADTSALATLVLAEDAAAADGGPGIAPFAKRQDTLATDTSADGDLSYFKVDSLGRLYTNTDITSDVADDEASTENPLLVGGVAHDVASALTELSADGDKGHMLLDLYRRVFINDACNVAWQVSAATVGATSAQIDGTPLNGRTKVIIQNQSNNSVWIKNTTAVADNTSVEIPKNSSMEFPFGEALPIHAISDGAGRLIAFMEAA
jgi:hypothetical protein